VQVLRNRGYALGGDEEDLKTKLQELDRKASDPALGARGEEIWARMLTVQERAKILKTDIERSGAEASEVLDEDTTKKAKKVCHLITNYVRECILTCARYWKTTTDN
jgi:nuclear pore complex protein Nup54